MTGTVESSDRGLSRNCEFEVHLDEHNKEKSRECEICGKRFFLEWRLKKHKHVHEKGARLCHFYNNRKQCPFETIGCKFRHESSGKCSFSVSRNRLCQFEHLEPNLDIENISDIEIDEINDEAINNLVNCERSEQNL